MALLTVKLLGSFEAHAASGSAIGPLGRKAQALLALLAISPGRALTRDKLIALLWSDRAEAQARASLRQVLTELRQALGDVSGLLVSVRDGVRLDAAGIEVDALRFERLAKDGSAQALAEATALYRSDLLDGFDAHDAAFEDWLRVERERMRALAIDALARFGTQQSGEAAIGTAKRLLALDPLNEPGHRALMKALAAAGNRAGALKQYQACREALREALDTEPEPETTKLHDAIRAGQIDASSPSSISATPAHADRAPDKPSIAVLPFTNMSGDPEQEYFSDGITEDIITELSRFRELRVLARNSSFAFKGQSVSVRKLGQELGADFIAEGSVRKVGNRVRVTAQLVETESGDHVWAERFDRELSDVFAVQDELVRAIAVTLPTKIDAASLEKAWRKPSGDLTAYEFYLRARSLGWKTTSNFDEAKALTRKALEVDPDFAPAHGFLAQNLIYAIHLLGREYDGSLAQAKAHIDRALALDPNDARVHATAAAAHIMAGEHARARIHGARALALNPNEIFVIFTHGLVLAYLGEARAAIDVLTAGDRVNVFAPDDVRLEGLFDAYYMAGEYESAVATYCRWRTPVCHMHAEAAAAYAQLGRMDESRVALASCLASTPMGWTLKEFVANHVRMCARPEDREHWLGGYRKAGLIE